MIPDAWVWPVWASSFLVPWAVLFRRFPAQRRAMVWASLFTAPFGLTEPLFVPEYWSPPSLFDLARRTGFDIESVAFSFAIGGVGAVLFNLVAGATPEPVALHERRHRRHRYHGWALTAPFLIFPALYPWPWNPIYAGTVAMAVGAVANVLCRPDLKSKTAWGALLFLLYYVAFLAGMELTAPGYVERVWNLQALSGLMLWRFPLEELLFAAGFGAYWAGVYEHFNWRRLVTGRGVARSPQEGR